MTNPNNSIFGPKFISQMEKESVDDFNFRVKKMREAHQKFPSLSKREYMATAALQGIVSSLTNAEIIDKWFKRLAPNASSYSLFASDAVLLADALIAELNKGKVDEK